MDIEIVSQLSNNTGSRSEHMAYLTKELGLDRTTAGLLYRAERLQEKGQLKLALKYYQQVLKQYPDCVEARENARMTQDMIREQEPAVQQNRIPEQNYTVTEMQIEWHDRENIQSNYEPDPDNAAFAFAKSHLLKSGHGSSLLKLLKNEILEDVCDADTGWAQFVRGMALFQVTLIRDPPDSPEMEALIEEWSQRMMASPLFPMGESQGSSVPPSVPPEGNQSAGTNHEQGEGTSSEAGSSRFADADSTGM